MKRYLRAMLPHKTLQAVRGRLPAASVRSAKYWTEHNVTLHEQFASATDSLAYFNWRNDQYFGYIDLMPVSGQDGREVLDYGCGPGNDLVGFGIFSNPSRLVGADVSRSSLSEARHRVSLHGFPAEFVQIDPLSRILPFDDESFDHIHSSGVLHHIADPRIVLAEFRRILRPGGTINVMVYNYDSLWLHLYVAYQRGILQGLHSEEDIREQFKRSTDGEDCPISNCYRPCEWIALCVGAGLNAVHIGNAVSMNEMTLLPLRFSAIQNRKLRPESRQFLVQLEQDAQGIPTYRGHRAGVDACYRLTKQAVVAL